MYSQIMEALLYHRVEGGEDTAQALKARFRALFDATGADADALVLHARDWAIVRNEVYSDAAPTDASDLSLDAALAAARRTYPRD